MEGPGWDGKRGQEMSSFTCRMGTLCCSWQGSGARGQGAGVGSPSEDNCSSPKGTPVQDSPAEQAEGRTVKVGSREPEPTLLTLSKAVTDSHAKVLAFCQGAPAGCRQHESGVLGFTQTAPWLQRVAVGGTEGG